MDQTTSAASAARVASRVPPLLRAPPQRAQSPSGGRILSSRLGGAHRDPAVVPVPPGQRFASPASHFAVAERLASPASPLALSPPHLPFSLGWRSSLPPCSAPTPVPRLFPLSVSAPPSPSPRPQVMHL